MSGKDASRLPEFLKDEDTFFPVVVSWALGVPLFTLLGFYAGTIFGSPHIIDLQVKDIYNGFIGAAIGAGTGVLLAIGITIFFPPHRRREMARTRSNGHHE